MDFFLVKGMVSGKYIFHFIVNGFFLGGPYCKAQILLLAGTEKMYLQPLRSVG
jgi:hypothetical protein